MSYEQPSPQDESQPSPEPLESESVNSPEPPRKFRIVDTTAEHEGEGISIIRIGPRERPNSMDDPPPTPGQ